MAVTELDKYFEYAKNPLLFIEDMFWLTPQRVKPDFSELLNSCRATGDYSKMNLSMFEPFVRYENLSWQQVEIILAVSRACNDEDKRRIAVRSWHGIGKSSVISMIMIRFLFCYYHSVIWCTAPTAMQMHDVLWKELALWKDRLPDAVKANFDWSRDYLRVWIKEADKWAWYARARTSAKENPEALAWLHSDHLMILADEASWVDDPIFETSQSAGTNKNAIFLMISNPTRLEWYFYRAFDSDTFQRLRFNSEESPLVDNEFVQGIVADYGKDSDQYRVRVLWEFPKAWLMDDKWWIPLFDPNDITFVDEEDVDEQMKDYSVLWIDPSGSWKDFSSFVARTSFYAKRVYREPKSTEKSIAMRTAYLKDIYTWITDDKIFYDNFWVWANVWQELAKEWIFARWVNAWDRADDENTFLNKRAECYWRLRNELRLWLRLIGNREQWKDLFMIKYKRTLKWQIRIMSKEEMRKEYWKSPDDADALMLTYWDSLAVRPNKRKEIREAVNPFTWQIIKWNLSNKTIKAW